MKTKAIIVLAAAGLSVGLSGCGFIKSLFPDKGKDYQYTSEIAPLVYPKDLAKVGPPGFTPTDLTDSSPVQAPDAPSAGGQSNSSAVPEAPAVPEKLLVAPEPQPAEPEKTPASNTPTDNTAGAAVTADNGQAKNAAPKHAPLVSTVLKEGGVQLLRVDGNFDTVWLAVNKALSRKSVEVTDRNSAAQTVLLRYEDPAQAAASRNLLDETLYVLSGMPSTDKQYALKFSAHGQQQTDVAVYNEQQQPVADDSSLSLLKLLQNAI